MNTAVINVRVEPTTKRQAKKIADELGLSLSSLIHGFLKNVIRTKSVTFSLSEEPSEYLIQSLKESQADIKAGRVISFKTWEEEHSYLNKLIADDKKRNKS